MSKKQAFQLIDSLRVEINKEVSLGFNIEDVFSRFAVDFSIDPSVQNNLGFLGWVPWGQTVMSFQKPLFDLKINLCPVFLGFQQLYHKRSSLFIISIKLVLLNPAICTKKPA